MFFKSNYGIIKDNYLILYNLNNEMIAISAISEIKICARKNTNWNLVNYFKKKLYDFIIIMDSQEKITFTFSKKHLPKIIAFKTQIWHTKFCLKDSTLKKSEDISDANFTFEKTNPLTNKNLSA
ncbi:hypothetical protein [Flavobacterium sangjuense]|uniref:Uncharacterized protein n=1 Tax=Flavobacterium sangjuense TaxID=2518177 RepID=A0A4P7PRB2_9FLAO|nr:hypothetical protein [Flavobacterium sangjuense]QBZ96592.1 hypothetical protein GS03_00065 [Flavobacterium sangjuense]